MAPVFCQRPVEYASTYYLLRRSTPNHKHSNKPRHPGCFIENLAVAEVENLAVAAVVLNIERNDAVFARIRCLQYIPYVRILVYLGSSRGLEKVEYLLDTPPFPSSRPDPVIGGVLVITVRLPCSYIRANQNTGNRVLVTPGPRDIPVCRKSHLLLPG